MIRVNCAALRNFLIVLGVFFPPAASSGAITVNDDRGASVTVQQPAGRIISLAPHVTELLFAAGAGDKVVGAVRYSYYPEAARAIPTIGETSKLDVERIVALDPDLIVAWQSNAAADTATLRKLGFPMFVSEPVSLEAIADSIIALGALADTKQTADAAGAAFRDRLAGLRLKFSGKRVISTFYQFWHDPIFTINGSHLISEVMRLCGGRNVFAGMASLSAQINMEAVLGANPEVIIASGIDATPPPWLDHWQRWPELAAVRNGRIYYIPPDLIQRHTPRILDGAEMMCEFLDQARRTVNNHSGKK